MHSHLLEESAIRNVNDTELSSFFSPLNLNSLFLCALWYSNTGSVVPSLLLHPVHELKGINLYSVSMSMSMDKGPDFFELDNLGFWLGKSKGSRIGSMGFWIWRNGSLRSSFADKRSDAGTIHFRMNSLICGSVTLWKEAGLMPCRMVNAHQNIKLHSEIKIKIWMCNRWEMTTSSWLVNLQM